MHLQITIDTSNAAFGETEIECGEELARILRELADNLADNGPQAQNDSPFVRDVNGNCVGSISYMP